ncbi:tetratricopeptide repeat protein [Goodfellowiella coeruleoviolacea]|uniref:tetratricopeptide repeat protein n=1 Tax=Goodfellowiella coeruleoviolacea TaxID=334858 RepID=UPI0020A5FABD|nr:tetratricopeptide repeat protein [Goodfellowiella coeruleoviolacea]
MSTSAEGVSAGRAALADFVEHAERGDWSAALPAAERAVGLAGPGLLGPALNCVGLARHRLGELAGATAAFGRAADDPRSPVRWFALLHSARVWTELAERGRARVALTEVVESGHPDLAPEAGAVLAELSRGEGDVKSAVKWLREVVDSGHPRHRPPAATALAALLSEVDDRAGAERARAQAAEPAPVGLVLPGPAEIAAYQVDIADRTGVRPAAVDSALRRYQAGDVAAARSALRALADTAWPAGAVAAAAVLAGIDLVEGDPVAARALLTRVAASGDFANGPRAALVLALLDTLGAEEHATLGRFLTGVPEAVASAEALAEDGTNAQRAAIGAVLLGDLLVRSGRLDQAVDHLTGVDGSALTRCYASYLRGTLLLDNALLGGDEVDLFDQAAEELAGALGTDQPFWPWAAMLQVDLVSDSDAELDLYERVIEHGHPGLLARACLDLGQRLAEWEYQDEVSELAERVLVTGPDEAVPWFAWGMVVEGNVWDAQYVLEQIPEWDPEHGGAAAVVRLVVRREFDAARPVLLRLCTDGNSQFGAATQLCRAVAKAFRAGGDTAAHDAVKDLLIEVGDVGNSAFAVHRLCERATAHAEAGELDRAVELVERAVIVGARSDAGAALDAVVDVARSRHLAGDLRAADALYRVVVDADEAGASGRKAATGLVVSHTQRGEAVEAAAIRRRSGFDEHYCYHLGVALRRAGEHDAAATAYALVMAVDGAELAARAAYFLGDLERARGDVDAAVTAYERAERLADAHYSPIASYRLGLVHKQRGDLAAARAAQQRCADSGHAEIGHWGRLELGRLAGLAGDNDQARRCFLELADVSEQRFSIEVALSLGYLAKGERDVAEATRWFGRIIDTGDPEQAPFALAHLAELHYLVEDWAGAERHYRSTLDRTDRPDLVAEAAYRVGEMRHRAGDPAAAVRFLEIARDTGNAAFAPKAAALLDRLSGQPA